MELEGVKMYSNWGVQIEALSDEQAGRFIKAVYNYIRNGRTYEFTRIRPETGLILEALEMIRLDEAQNAGLEKQSGNESICEKMSRCEIAKKAANAR